MSKILITGGAGYIGSHIVRQLGEFGRSVVVLDDLSSGFRRAVLYGELIIGDMGDESLVSELIENQDIGSVIHLAAYTRVEESVKNPLKYYENNICKTQRLLQTCINRGIQNFIFSSSAAVYGIPPGPIISEDSVTIPINPYGTTKLLGEWMVRDAANAHDFRFVSLRYFNVAGSDPEGRIGQSTPEATLLIKVACETALGKRPHMYIFGSDYPTPDGTAVRDFIHVEDLADAHLKALIHLENGGESLTLNCGYGHGHSVREVVEATRRISGVEFEVREATRRSGDPPSLIAKADRIGKLLSWVPQYDNLEFIIQTSLAWERKLRNFDGNL